MINVQSLAVVLRALRQGEPVSRATGAMRPIASVAPIIALAPDDGTAPALRAATDHLGDGSEPARLRVPPGAVDPRAARDGDRSPATPALPGGATATATGTTVELSAGAALLREMLATDAGTPRSVIHATRPLVTREGQGAPDLANALERAVRHSGLFYEAHLARWASDGYATTEVMLEPQAAWSIALAGDVEPPPPGALLHGEATRSDAAAMVRQQLDALETGRFVWAGEIWPGQAATIHFEDDAHTGERDADHPLHDARAGSTRIELDLPSLGRVTAVITVRGNDVTCRVTAPSAAAQSRLDATGPDFAAALQSHAMTLARFAVDHGPAR